MLLLRLNGYIQQGIYTLSLAHLGLGLIVFAQHGRDRATPTGLYFLSSGLLFGGAGLIVAERAPHPTALWNVALVTLIADAFVLWIRARPDRHPV